MVHPGITRPTYHVELSVPIDMRAKLFAEQFLLDQAAKGVKNVQVQLLDALGVP